MLGPDDFINQQENIAVSETQSQTKLVTQNHFLDEYNGYPTLEKIRQMIIQKKANGDMDKKIWVSVGWALEMAEHFTANTSFTYQMVHDAPKKLYQYERRMLEAENRANLEHKKAQDLLVENTLVYERLGEISMQTKENQDRISQELEKNRIVKLSISRVKMFLAFCKPEDDLEDFYVKIDEKGNMQRIVRNPEEL